jgi:AcrR family transcriptional regulator
VAATEAADEAPHEDAPRAAATPEDAPPEDATPADASPEDAPPEGRRARLRRETEAELSRAALAEVREHSANELSLRRVARRMGMSPAGLYRYVDSREALLTRLITEAYDDLADHLHAATGEADRSGLDRPEPDPPLVAGPEADVADRLRAAAVAYRHWAVTHPQEFGLLYGDPIPGYAAPPGGPTVAAMSRVGAGLGRPLVEADAAGRLRPVVREEVGPEVVARLEPLRTLAGHHVRPEVALTLLVAWGRLHGQVSLEVFGHHRWLFPDGCAELFEADVEAMLRDLGVAE